jgi:hypothetical protein
MRSFFIPIPRVTPTKRKRGKFYPTPSPQVPARRADLVTRCGAPRPLIVVRLGDRKRHALQGLARLIEEAASLGLAVKDTCRVFDRNDIAEHRADQLPSRAVRGSGGDADADGADKPVAAGAVVVAADCARCGRCCRC